MTWDISVLDLDAYLARTGASTELPSLEALTRLQAVHVRTFPFENLDVLLEQHGGVDLGTVQDKFVGRERGGYCFEHATLFHAVLTRLGYDVEPRLARVGDPQTAPRTHLDLVVTLDGKRYLSDPGIGVPPLAPIELADSAEESTGLWPHRIRQSEVEQPGGVAWELWRRRTCQWERMHVTDELPVRRVDVAMGHHWTSTSPSSHFRTSLMCNRHGADGDGTPTLTTVTLDAVTIGRRGSEPESRPYRVKELPELLGSCGIRLASIELERLAERVQALRAAVAD